MGGRKLEPQPDGSVAFEAEDGKRWRHIDREEGRVGEGYREFRCDATGEERQYRFGPQEPHDATLDDLREQLRRAQPVKSSNV